MTNENDKPPPIKMRKLDPHTGEEIPSTEAEQAEALAELRASIRAGKIEFTDEVKQDLINMGISPEIIESWLAGKDS